MKNLVKISINSNQVYTYRYIDGIYIHYLKRVFSAQSKNGCRNETTERYSSYILIYIYYIVLYVQSRAALWELARRSTGKPLSARKSIFLRGSRVELRSSGCFFFPFFLFFFTLFVEHRRRCVLFCTLRPHAEARRPTQHQNWKNGRSKTQSLGRASLIRNLIVRKQHYFAISFTNSNYYQSPAVQSPQLLFGIALWMYLLLLAIDSFCRMYTRIIRDRVIHGRSRDRRTSVFIVCCGREPRDRYITVLS